MNILQQLKQDQFKVSQQESIEIKCAGCEDESEKAVKLLLYTRRGELESVWIPKSVLLNLGETVTIPGWFAAKNLFNFVNKKYCA